MSPHKCLDSLARGMDQAADDKARILPFVKPGRVLEVGCGSGTVLELLLDAGIGWEIVGVDYDPRMVAMARKRLIGRNGKVMQGDVHKHEEWGGGWDTIIVCSCLHEALEVTDDPAFREVQGAALLASMSKLLNPGGRLIVRDGVRPYNRPLRLRFWNRDVADMFDWFASDYRCMRVHASTNGRREVTVDSIVAYEFLTKYFYRDNWYQEMGESYGWAGLETLTDSLAMRGLQVVKSEAYTIPYLADRWAQDVFVTRPYDGTPVRIDSTMLIVTEVPA